MLNFFFTRHDLPEIQTIEATPFEIQSSAEYTDKVIPFSHIYVTSESYLKLIHDSLDSESQSQLITVSERQSGVIKKQQNFPLRITDYQIDTLQELLDVLSDSENINIIVINGIGLGVVLPLIQSLNSDLHPQHRLGKSFGILNITGALGGTAGAYMGTVLAAGTVAGIAGWR